jgi:TonB family protein
MSLLENIIFTEWVLNAALQSLVILSLGALLVFMFRHKSAPLRSWICLVTMLALVLLPFFSLSLNQINYLPFQADIPIALLSNTLDQSPSPSFSVSYDIAERPVYDDNTGEYQSSQPDNRNPLVVKIINIFGIIWGIGLIFMLLHFILGVVSLYDLKKGKKEVKNPRFAVLLDSAEKVFFKQNKTRVFATHKVPYPMALGVFKPIILIPERMLHKCRDYQLKGILIHELSHIYHKDLLTGILQRFITAMYWWNPLSYALSRTYSRAREEVSDTHVLLQNDSKEYAECLINLAEKTTLWKQLSVSVGLASPHIPLKDRVKHILSKERIMDTKIKKSTIAVMGALAFLLVLGISGSRLIFANAQANSTIEKADYKLPDIAAQDQKEQEQEQKKSEKKDIKPPKLLTQVDPVYPEEARKAGIEGIVVVEAATDETGHVKSVKVLKSIPMLDQAAIDAVKQWVYEPMVINGEPKGIVFTTTVRFSLDDKGEGKVSGAGGVTGTKPAVKAVQDIRPPKLIKIVEPDYPEEAKKAGIEGTVILEATTDIYGKIIDAKILRSVPELDQAAIDAVRQWVYEPMVIDGEPQGVTFTVTCTFTLDEKDKARVGGVEGGIEGGVVGKAEGPVGAAGDKKPPKLIREVAPVYPEEARKAEIEGVVIIEVTTDIYGRVKNARILNSIPMLDQAAIDAVKQWVYEPTVVDGKPIEDTFTVTVTFKLK